MKPEFIYLIFAIIMMIFITIHSIVTKIKTPSDYASIGGISGIICQIISIGCCFSLFSTLSLYVPTGAWILLVLLILSAVVSIGYMIRDFITGKTYDKPSNNSTIQEVIPEVKQEVTPEIKQETNL